MFLVGAPDYQSNNVSYPRMCIFAYDRAREDLGQELDHDHERVVARIAQWVEQYRAEQGLS